MKRGQLITGRKSLSADTGIPEQVVRTCLKRLEKTGEISQQTTNKYTTITICNYDKYQLCAPADNQQNNQQLTNKQPATNQQLTTNNNENNEKNERSNKKNTPSKSLFGTFQNVLLTDDEYQKLLNQFGDSLKERINNLSEGIASKGYKYKSHYATILNWARRDNNGGGKRPQESFAEIKDRKMRQAMKEFVEE